MARFEYKPVDRLNALPHGENSGDLKFPMLVLAIIGGCIAVVVLAVIGLVRLIA